MRRMKRKGAILLGRLLALRKMKAGGRGDLATSHWKFYSTSPLRDSSLMLNLLHSISYFF
jgi:hypothetical protein